MYTTRNAWIREAFLIGKRHSRRLLNIHEAQNCREKMVLDVETIFIKLPKASYYEALCCLVYLLTGIKNLPSIDLFTLCYHIKRSLLRTLNQIRYSVSVHERNILPPATMLQDRTWCNETHRHAIKKGKSIRG